LVEFVSVGSESSFGFAFSRLVFLLPPPPSSRFRSPRSGPMFSVIHWSARPVVILRHGDFSRFPISFLCQVRQSVPPGLGFACSLVFASRTPARFPARDFPRGVSVRAPVLSAGDLSCRPVLSPNFCSPARDWFFLLLAAGAIPVDFFGPAPLLGSILATKDSSFPRVSSSRDFPPHQAFPWSPQQMPPAVLAYSCLFHSAAGDFSFHAR
jgi:hypothetical protein